MTWNRQSKATPWCFVGKRAATVGIKSRMALQDSSVREQPDGGYGARTHAAEVGTRLTTVYQNPPFGSECMCLLTEMPEEGTHRPRSKRRETSLLRSPTHSAWGPPYALLSISILLALGGAHPLRRSLLGAARAAMRITLGSQSESDPRSFSNWLKQKSLLFA